MGYRLLTGNVLSFCRHYTGPLFHGFMSDMPYHLQSIVDRFGSPDSSPAKGDLYNRTSKGFLGQVWDGGDISFDPETWALISNVLHDGAIGFAYASSRGYYRMAAAMESAGLILHNSIFGWVFGSGMAKATKVKNSEAFEGHRYGVQALKPGIEPIIVFQKPFKGTALKNILETGAGAYNITGARIGDEDITYKSHLAKSLVERNAEHGARPYVNGLPTQDEPEISVSGRWPKNFYVEHSPDCDKTYCVPDCPVLQLNQQSEGVDEYFFAADYVAELLEQASNVAYNMKPLPKEKEAGLDRLPLVSAAELTGHKPGSAGLEGNSEQGYDHNPLAKVTSNRRNIHPTVKPLSLNKWLATLLLPPASIGERRIFCPFSGSGSEMIGALLAGWDCVIGVELSKEYAQIARNRIRYWLMEPLPTLATLPDPDQSGKPKQLSFI